MLRIKADRDGTEPGNRVVARIRLREIACGLYRGDGHAPLGRQVENK
jgi:hypothetical protein